MSDNRGWHEEAWGDADHGVRRRYRRSWHQYAAAILGFLGAIMTIGAITASSATGVLAGVLVGASAWCLVRADGPRARNGQAPPPPPTRERELAWTCAAAVMVVVGVILTTL